MKLSQRMHLPVGGVTFFVAFTAMNISNFAFHMVTSRALAPDSYGALGALLSLMLVLQVPVAALQVAIAQQVAAHAARTTDPLGRLSARRMLLQMSLVAVAAAAFIALTSPLLRDFLKLDSTTPVLLLALDMFPLLVGLVPRAVFIGAQQFRPAGIALVAGALVRLVLGYALGQMDYGVAGAMAATVAGDFVMAAILLWPLETGVRNAPIIQSLQIRLRDATAAAVAFAGMLLLVGVDTILARHFLSPLESGIYVAAATAARSALFLSVAIGLIFFPRFARTDGEGPEARRAFMQALLLVTGLGTFASLVIVMLPKFFVTVLFGDAYSSAAGIVGTLAVDAAMLGVLTLIVYFHLARRTPSAWFSWGGIVAVGLVIGFFHSDRYEIAKAAIVTTGVLTALMLWMTVRRTRGEYKVGLAQAHRPPLLANEADIDLTVVVPFYNPGPRFVPSLEKLVDILREEGVTFEVIAVSDGSTDDSVDRLHELHSDVVRSVVLPRNWGKGEALRVGFSLGRGRYVGFIDADGDIDASLFHPFLQLVNLYQPDIILGSKRHPMSEVEYPALRRIYSWGYQQLIRAMFHLDVQDTQTGLKLVRREVLAGVLPRMVERGFAFDLELFVVARHLGYRKVFEAPVRIGTRFTSTVSRRAVVAMFHDTFQIFYRLRVLHEYDSPARSTADQAPTDAIEVPPPGSHGDADGTTDPGGTIPDGEG